MWATSPRSSSPRARHDQIDHLRLQACNTIDALDPATDLIVPRAKKCRAEPGAKPPANKACKMTDSRARASWTAVRTAQGARRRAPAAPAPAALETPAPATPAPAALEAPTPAEAAPPLPEAMDVDDAAVPFDGGDVETDERDPSAARVADARAALTHFAEVFAQLSPEERGLVLS